MPPFPPDGGEHIVVVHFPIALLFVAPVFVLLGAFTGLRSMMISALILMALGVAGAFVATSTGEEAMNWMGDFDEDVVSEDDPYDVLDHHEEQATYARNLFTGLSLVYAGVVLLTTFAKPMSKAIPRILINLVFLGLWAYPVIEMANAAHEGGRLVHQFGLRAPLSETAEEEEPEEDEDTAEEEDAADSEDEALLEEEAAAEDQPEEVDPAESDAVPSEEGETEQGDPADESETEVEPAPAS